MLESIASSFSIVFQDWTCMYESNPAVIQYHVIKCNHPGKFNSFSSHSLFWIVTPAPVPLYRSQQNAFEF